MTKDFETDSELLDPSWVDEDLHRFFDEFEGDERAHLRPRPNQPRHVWRNGFLIAAAAIVGAGLTAILVRGNSTADTGSAGDAEGACQAGLHFHDVLYEGQAVPRGITLAGGEKLGFGAMDSCNDTPLQPGNESGSADLVSLVSLEGIPPTVAVGSADSGSTIFVAAGRCAGFDSVEQLRCLREPLRFGGHVYAATALQASRVKVGAAIGSGQLRGHAVRVRGIPGIKVSKAVVIGADGSLIYLSDRTCFFSPAKVSFERDLVSCLTGPSAS